MIVSLNGSLLYLRYTSGVWNKYTVLDSKGGGKRINSVKLIKFNGRLHAFYCVEYEGRMMLVHHISEGCEFKREPHVIDYINLRCAYDIRLDDNFNIHILYADENSYLKYAVFVNSKKNYTTSEIGCEDEIRSVNCAFYNDELYAAYLSRERDYNVINCIKTSIGEKHMVGFGVDALSEPCIFVSGDDLYIQWCEKGYAFECSIDDKFKISKPLSLGRSAGILKLRSFENETVSFLDKCAANRSKNPFPSAQSAFEKLLVKEKRTFEIKGSEAERYAGGCTDKSDSKEIEEFAAHLVRRIGELEVQMQSIVKIMQLFYNPSSGAKEKILMSDVGEINEENLEEFNKLNPDDFNVTNSEGDEYTEIKEES